MELTPRYNGHHTPHTWAPHTKVQWAPHTCMQVVLADPLDACSRLEGDNSGKVVVFRREMGSESCSLQEKANNVANSGAVAGEAANRGAVTHECGPLSHPPHP